MQSHRCSPPARAATFAHDNSIGQDRRKDPRVFHIAHCVSERSGLGERGTPRRWRAGPGGCRIPCYPRKSGLGASGSDGARWATSTGMGMSVARNMRESDLVHDAVLARRLSHGQATDLFESGHIADDSRAVIFPNAYGRVGAVPVALNMRNGRARSRAQRAQELESLDVDHVPHIAIGPEGNNLADTVLCPWLCRKNTGALCLYGLDHRPVREVDHKQDALLEMRCGHDAGAVAHPTDARSQIRRVGHRQGRDLSPGMGIDDDTLGTVTRGPRGSDSRR